MKCADPVSDKHREGFMGHRVLVTGGTGFVGRHLCARLAGNCAWLGVMTRQPIPSRNGVCYLTGEIGDADFIGASIREYQPDFIFHLAGCKHTRTQLPKDFQSALDLDIRGGLNLFQAALSLPNLRSLVCLGSAGEYGSAPAPYREELREQPSNAYAYSKLCLTYLAELYHRLHGLPAVILRLSIGYGPGQGSEVMVSALIQSLLQGHEFPMTPGQQTRDYLYVADVVEALLLAALSPSAVGQIINIGSGHPVCLLDLAHKIEKLVGRAGLIKDGALPYRAGEAMEYSVENAKARQILGWSPRIGLDEGLSRTVAWFKNPN